MKIIKLKNQDGLHDYSFVKGGFCIEKDLLYLSIETSAVDDEMFPDRYLLALDGFKMQTSLSDMTINMMTNTKDEAPNVYVYTTFHVCEVEAIFNIKVIDINKINVEFQLATEDLNYYDERAKHAGFSGSVELQRKPKEQLWIPS